MHSLTPSKHCYFIKYRLHQRRNNEIQKEKKSRGRGLRVLISGQRPRTKKNKYPKKNWKTEHMTHKHCTGTRFFSARRKPKPQYKFKEIRCFKYPIVNVPQRKSVPLFYKSLYIVTNVTHLIAACILILSPLVACDNYTNRGSWSN